MNHQERTEHKKKEKSISEFWDNIKQPNMHVIEISEGRGVEKHLNK